MECIFCKIRDGKINSDIVYSDSEVFVIKDINPKAPVHLLVIPNKHIPTLNDVEDESTMALLLKTARKMAVDFNVAEKGYRLILNCNEQGGQSVYHVHVHLLAGEQMHGF